MKKLYTLFLAFAAVASSSAQDWQWQNPQPQGNSLNGVMFADVSTGFAVGDLGTILKTSDGGETWNLLISGTTIDLNSVFFLNCDTGFAVGGYYDDGNIILKTNDGGTTWTNQSIMTGDLFLNSVFFINDTLGFIAGRNEFSAQEPYLILKTWDGGVTWEMNSYGTGYDLTGLTSIYFAVEDVGYAVGSTLMKTTDGGITWTDLGNASGKSVFFTNENTGYITGIHDGTILKTTNGGMDWTTLYSDSNYIFSSIFFLEEETGFAVGGNSYSGIILSTDDGGSTWTEQVFDDLTSMHSVHFPASSVGFVVGGKGRIVKTISGGSQWSVQTSWVTENGISEIQFPTADVGYFTSGGELFKTTDGGENWTILNTGSSSLTSCFFLNESTGYATGLDGTIMKTLNGGSTWTLQNYDTAYALSSIYFVGQDTGYAVGETFLRTNNGGMTWINLNNATGGSLFFTDANTGYTVRNLGWWNPWSEILKTTNSGNDWSITTFYNMDYIGMNDLYFTDENTGYAVGNTGMTGDQTVFKTIDAGLTWTEQTIGSGGLISVYFFDNNTGYAVGWDGWRGDGCIRKTTDGGLTWNLLNIVCRDVLIAVFFTDEETGYIGGEQGVFLKTEDGGGFPVGLNDQPRPLKALTIYPNPAYDKIHIEIPDVNKTGTLSIYNLSGQEILKDRISGSKTIIDISTLNMGIYLVKVMGERNVWVGKIIKE